MSKNLLKNEWASLDSDELKILLNHRIGGPGQIDPTESKVFLPLAGSVCRLVLTYRGTEIVEIKPGSAFDSDEWTRIVEEIEQSVLTGPTKIGREYAFSSFRVKGSWRGNQSGVQILPPPNDAPQADVEMAEHPFILEFPIRVSNLWPLTNHRRMREHR